MSTTVNNLVDGAAGRTTDDQTDAAARREKGEFVRGVSTARNWIADDDPNTQFPVEPNRYHLYVAYNCPWCHRVLLARALLGLENVISVDVLFPNRSDDDEPLGGGLWKFEPDGQTGLNHQFVSFPSCTSDTILSKKYAKEIYQASGIDNQTSVPILFDKQTRKVVNNESSEIVRMFGTAFAKLSTRNVNLYPKDLEARIDELNNWIYTDVANGSYKAGFSSSQSTYETAYHAFFAALDRLEDILTEQQFLTGDTVTEADVRLFPPLFRLDPIYYLRFKLNAKYLWEYPNLWRWMGDVMNLPGMDAMSNAEYLQHCKQGYFGRTGNGTVPLGPPGYPECYRTKHWSHK